MKAVPRGGPVDLNPSRRVNSAVLSVVLVLTLALGFGTVFMRGCDFARPPDEVGRLRNA